MPVPILRHLRRSALALAAACALCAHAAGAPLARAADVSESSRWLAAAPNAARAAKRPGRRRSKAPAIDPMVTAACVDRHARGQDLRLGGQLLESRIVLRECAAAECPATLQADCVGWLHALEGQIPSLTFRVTVDGQTRTDIDVFVDGKLAREPASGQDLELDPGRHQLRVVVDGFAPFEKEVLLQDRERYRAIEVAFTSPKRPPTTERPVPVGTYVLGGVALASAVSATLWGISSMQLRHSLENSCAPNCRTDSVGELERRALLTDVSWSIGAASLIGAGLFFLFRPELPVQVDVAWVPGGGVGTLRIETF